MEKVNQTVSDALETHHSIRILGELPTEKLNPEDYLASTRELISSLVDSWKEKANLRLLAVEIWARHTYFALDFKNDEYNYGNAHNSSDSHTRILASVSQEKPYLENTQA